MGGMPRAIAQGFVQREIERSAYRKQKETEELKRTVVGVNKYSIEEGERIKLLSVDQKAVEAQLARVKAFKSSRDAQKHGAALKALDAAAAGDENLLPPIVEAVKAHATVGEICNVFRQRFGEHREPSTLWE